MQTNATLAMNAKTQKKETGLRVAIQGYAGAFHEIATRQFFKDQDLSIVPAHTFTDLVGVIENEKIADVGLMAIENTLAGSLMSNYRLLLKSKLVITGEVFLRIHQNLLTLPGVRLEELKEVHSHPVAIAQCRAFFKRYPHIRLVETVDTALSAKKVSENKLRTVGAIASELAADLYDLEILAPRIETSKQNHTRFFVLERKADCTPLPTANKISISFTVGHDVGSLYQVLAVLAAYDVNLTKIQSAPIIGKPWEYRFYVDFILSGSIGWKQAVEAIRPITKELDVLGSYVQGVKGELK